MAFTLPSATRTTDTRPAWSGMAVLMEAMILLLFLVGSLAVMTQLFAASALRAREGEQLAQAVALATDAAERFAADPATAPASSTEGDLVVACDVTSEPTDAGTLYHATITVTDAGAQNASEAPLYTLATTRYVEGVS